MSASNSPHSSWSAAGSQSGAAPRRTVERRQDLPARERLVQRVLSEFREMPCLRLTPPQAQRLFGLRADIATRVINSLIADGHVRLDPDGRYVATKMS